MQGTIVNAIAILLGSVLGAWLHTRLPKNIVSLSLQGIGLFVLLIGITMAQAGTDYVVMIFSIVAGAAIGEALAIEQRVNGFAEWLRKKAKLKDDRLVAACLTASLIYCTGSMAVLGSIEDGLGQEPKILFAKSAIDFLTSIALASTMGIGVALSAIPVSIYQGSLTLLASSASGILVGETLKALTGVGGILLMGVGVNLLELKKISVMNLLPSLLVVLAVKLLLP